VKREERKFCRVKRDGRGETSRETKFIKATGNVTRMREQNARGVIKEIYTEVQG
jgi:hypothetical protein